MYAVLSEINEAIVRERDRQAMLETACRIAVAKGGFLMAWIGLIDAETGQLQISCTRWRWPVLWKLSNHFWKTSRAVQLQHDAARPANGPAFGL